MSDDKLNFLDGETPVEPATPPADPASAGPSPEVSRDPARPPPAPAPEPGHVPISALLDEREKRQAERAQREALERQIADLRAQAGPRPEPEPTEVLEAALYSQNLRASRRFAEREYGKDAVAQVHDWAARRCDEDPQFNHQMRSSEDPYEAALLAYNREQILANVRPADLAAFKAWQERQARSPSPSPASAPPPRSLATAPNAGGRPSVLVGPGEAFAAALNR